MPLPLQRAVPWMLAAVVAAAGTAPSAFADDWPQFRGPQRDGISAETGLRPSWPEGGPPLALTLDGVGEGFSSPVIAAGKVFVTGRVKDEMYVFAFEADSGQPLWRAACGTGYTGMWPGTRGTPTVDGGSLYVLSGRGRLTALAADTGQKAWSLDLFETFGAKPPMYGAAESVLVVGDRLICTPGGPDAGLAALDKRTGRTLWTSRGHRDEAGYASAITAQVAGEPQVIALTSKALVGVALADGTLRWRFADPFGGLMAESILTPIFRDGIVFAEGGHYCGGGAVRLRPADGAIAVEPLWKKSGGSTHVGGYVERGGNLYGETGRGWGCIDLATGEVRHRTRDIRGASTLWADGRFYALGEKGVLYLVQADPQGAEILSTFEIPNAGPQTWAYPALAQGRLYVRRLEKVFAYDLRP